jgi:aspartate carbamoyltransferase catalytic subunit
MKVDMVVMRHANWCRLFCQKCKSKYYQRRDGAHEHPTQALLDSYSEKN